MHWKIIATAFGWRPAKDEEGDPPLLVVWHPRLRRHFTGADAWKRAVLLSVRAPDTRNGLPRERGRRR
jgi:hypothetical protein